MSSAGPNRQRQLILNISPVEFGEVEVACTVLPYDGKEQIRGLRSEYGATHAFRRIKDKLYAVPMVAGVDQLDGKPATVILHHDHAFASFLARTAFVRYLQSINRPATSYNRIDIVAGSSSTNILSSVFPRGVVCPDWLQAHTVFRADFRHFCSDRRERFVGLTFDLGAIHRITRSCADLLQDGIDITNLYVGAYRPANDPFLAPCFALTGRVRDVRDGVCHLTDSRKDIGSLPIHEAYLEPRYDSLMRCLTHLCNTSASKVMQALTSAEGKMRDGEAKLAKLNTTLTRFNAAGIEIVPGVTMRFGAFLTETDNQHFPPTSVVQGPNYIFDMGAGKTDTWHERGLRTHRPFSASTFSPTRPRICIICQEKHVGRVEQFVQKLLNGIPAQGERKSAFEMGLVRMYALDEPIVQFFRANGDTPEAYRKAVREGIAESGEQGNKWNLALVQIDEHFHELPRERNPYYTTKAALLGRQIASQEFEIETAELPDYQLQYVLNNIALAIYAKLGGTPWLINCDRSVAHELVIGMGSAIIGEERFGNRDRVVGITTVFKGDGSYFLSNISRAIPMESFREELLNSLRTTIRQVQSTMNWQERDRIRLIFHSFKPMRNDEEADAVKAAMDDLGMYNVEYAFLHIANDHPYQLFDMNESGAPAGKSMKGRYAAGKGTLVSLSEEEVLLSLIGARDLKRPEDGLPRPVLMRLHKASTFRDLTYLARQAYRFSRHSWRSFFPASLPVTIYYSQLIAKLLGELALVPGWDDSAMLDQIGHTRWYL